MEVIPGLTAGPRSSLVLGLEVPKKQNSKREIAYSSRRRNNSLQQSQISQNKLTYSIKPSFATRGRALTEPWGWPSKHRQVIG